MGNLQTTQSKRYTDLDEDTAFADYHSEDEFENHKLIHNGLEKRHSQRRFYDEHDVEDYDITSGTVATPKKKSSSSAPVSIYNPVRKATTATKSVEMKPMVNRLPDEVKDFIFDDDAFPEDSFTNPSPSAPELTSRGGQITSARGYKPHAAGGGKLDSTPDADAYLEYTSCYSIILCTKDETTGKYTIVLEFFMPDKYSELSSTFVYYASDVEPEIKEILEKYSCTSESETLYAFKMLLEGEPIRLEEGRFVDRYTFMCTDYVFGPMSDF